MHSSRSECYFIQIKNKQKNRKKQPYKIYDKLYPAPDLPDTGNTFC